jgi:phospholipid/cholesterol/gamma-HCH transport system ATP-binding protein
VSLRSLSARVGELTEASFVLRAGEVLLVHLEEGSEELPLGDLAVGLQEPDAGRIEFLGTAWHDWTAGEQAAMRGRIGRVFEHPAWVGNLDILENLCLAQAHHTRRPLAELEAEAEALARGFGIQPVPDGRPAHASLGVLRRLEWVRALIGRPALLVLERPCQGVTREWVGRLVERVARAADEGAAVIWTTGEAWDRAVDRLPRAAVLAMRGARLEAASGVLS